MILSWCLTQGSQTLKLRSKTLHKASLMKVWGTKNLKIMDQVLIKQRKMLLKRREFSNSRQRSRRRDKQVQLKTLLEMGWSMNYKMRIAFRIWLKIRTATKITMAINRFPCIFNWIKIPTLGLVSLLKEQAMTWKNSTATQNSVHPLAIMTLIILARRLLR